MSQIGDMSSLTVEELQKEIEWLKAALEDAHEGACGCIQGYAPEYTGKPYERFRNCDICHKMFLTSTDQKFCSIHRERVEP